MKEEVMIMTCKAGSIRQVHRQFKQEGYEVSEYALRSWVKAGDVPAKYSGKKAVILYADVLSFLSHTAPLVPNELS